MSMSNRGQCLHPSHLTTDLPDGVSVQESAPTNTMTADLSGVITVQQNAPASTMISQSTGSVLSHTVS